jgi:hypothetical protein
LSCTTSEEAPVGVDALPVAGVVLAGGAARVATAEIFAASSGEIARPEGGVAFAGRDAPSGFASLDGTRGAKIGGSGSTGSPAFGPGLGCAARNDTPHEAQVEARSWRRRMGQKGRNPTGTMGSVIRTRFHIWW